MALRDAESEAAGPKVAKTAESHEETNSARPNISCTPPRTEMLEFLWEYLVRTWLAPHQERTCYNFIGNMCSS